MTELGSRGWIWIEQESVSRVGPPDGDSWPRVSIVTPSFNQAQFLEETIRSVLLQDYSNLEYIVIDGGSTDGSLEIIRKYANQLAFWVSEQDQGQSDAINKGLAKATGEIVAYLNSDDLYCPHAIRRAVEFLTAHPDVGIIYGDFSVVDETSRVRHACVVPPPFSLSRLLLWNLIPQPTAFVRREILDVTGPFDVTLHFCMDYDLWVRAALGGVRFARLAGSPLASLRDWSGNKSNSLYEEGLGEALSVLRRIYSDERLSSGLRRRREMAYAYVHMQVASDCYWRGERRKALKYLRMAVSIHKRIAGLPAFWGLFLKTIVGTRASRLAARLKRVVFSQS